MLSQTSIIYSYIPVIFGAIICVILFGFKPQSGKLHIMVHRFPYNANIDALFDYYAIHVPKDLAYTTIDVKTVESRMHDALICCGKSTGKNISEEYTEIGGMCVIKTNEQNTFQNALFLIPSEYMTRLLSEITVASLPGFRLSMLLLDFGIAARLI